MVHFHFKPAIVCDTKSVPTYYNVIWNRKKRVNSPGWLLLHFWKYGHMQKWLVGKSTPCIEAGIRKGRRCFGCIAACLRGLMIC